ncbi:hypothetical protein [Pseudomonas saliphila]|uniref:hypothetical protein n=1 Tax=Pseudomonas saliphila TaxID=2586906 RepID=UPI001239EA71|nr:hypothetical protein [Pseudomonas saliphila]
MPIYYLNCADQTKHECEEEVRVKLDIVGLTDEQIEAIEQGRSFRISAEQVEASALALDDEQTVELKRNGSITYRIDILSICDACGA